MAQEEKKKKAIIKKTLPGFFFPKLYNSLSRQVVEVSAHYSVGEEMKRSFLMYVKKLHYQKIKIDSVKIQRRGQNFEKQYQPGKQTTVFSLSIYLSSFMYFQQFHSPYFIKALQYPQQLFDETHCTTVQQTPNGYSESVLWVTLMKHIRSCYSYQC